MYKLSDLDLRLSETGNGMNPVFTTGQAFFNFKKLLFSNICVNTHIR
jgi:hypothetical protein